MTKSAVRAMDAVQALAKERFSQDVKKFVVTGASKRGWTTWLAGAVDGRVIGIAPMVIDMLNLPEQMPLQLRSFGAYSEQIADYTRLGLQEKLKEPVGETLLDLVDPWRHRSKMTMPKLIVLGTNDRYWPVDAVKVYFDGLPGEKHIHYVPNAGHGLGPGAVEAVTAFYAAVIAGEPRPSFTWKLRTEGGRAVLAVAAKDPPEKAELWTASSPTRDFREAKWTSAPMEKAAGGFEGALAAPADGFAALFGRLTYRGSLGGPYTLATNVEVIGGEKATGK
jgi:PhoPQ-activated pathogenicity-related protein